MVQPTAEDVRLWSPPAFDWASYGFDANEFPDPLDVRVQWAVGELYAVTGRTLDSIVTPEETAAAQKVIAAFTINEALGGSQDAIEVLSQPWLKSLTAGSYSETRFSPQERAGGSQQAPPYPGPLWALLWALMTDDKRDDWMFRLTGQHAPAGVMIEPHFGHHGGRYGPFVWGSGVTHPWPWG